MFIVDLAVPRDVEPEAARARRRVPLQRRRPRGHRARTTCRSGARRWRRPRQMIADAGRQLPALARRPHRRADDHRAARAITTTLRAAELERARKHARRRRAAGAGARGARARPHQQVPARAARRRSTAPATPSAPSWSRCSSRSTSCPTTALAPIGRRRGARRSAARHGSRVVSDSRCYGAIAAAREPRLAPNEIFASHQARTSSPRASPSSTRLLVVRGRRRATSTAIAR